MKRAQQDFFELNFSVYPRICEAALFLSFPFLFPHTPFFYLYPLYIYLFIYLFIYILYIIIKIIRYRGAYKGTREGLHKGVRGPFISPYVVPSKVLGRDYRGTTKVLPRDSLVPSGSLNRKFGVFLGLQLESMLLFKPQKSDLL